MKDQHEKIKGYRDLSQQEIDLMNEIKQVETTVAELVNKIYKNYPDLRWVSIATKDLQTGFMALVRSVAKPESAWRNQKRTEVEK